MNIDYAVFVLQGQSAHAFHLLEDSVARVPVIPAEPEARRTDAIFDGLKDKKVGLVGCGSLGGKIGAILTRAGVVGQLFGHVPVGPFAACVYRKPYLR